MRNLSIWLSLVLVGSGLTLPVVEAKTASASAQILIIIPDRRQAVGSETGSPSINPSEPADLFSLPPESQPALIRDGDKAFFRYTKIAL